MNALNPYLKAVVPAILAVLGVLGTVYGSLPWWAPVAAGVTALLTFLVPNTPKVTGTGGAGPVGWTPPAEPPK